jgi:hypothetical protein
VRKRSPTWERKKSTPGSRTTPSRTIGDLIITINNLGSKVKLHRQSFYLVLVLILNPNPAQINLLLQNLNLEQTNRNINSHWQDDEE